jgi:DNA-binding beta-propeller fold protein YncE
MIPPFNGVLLILIIILFILVTFTATGAFITPTISTQTFNTGINPSGLAVWENRLYVANNNNYGISGQDSVSVIDINTGQIIATITDSSFDEPYTITFYQGKAYVTNSGSPSVSGQSGTVTIVDLATNAVTGTISGFNGPSGFVVDSVHNVAYVNEYGAAGSVLQSGQANTIKVVDLTNNTITQTITVELAPAAMTLTSQGLLLVANYNDGNPGTGSMSIIDTTSNIVTQTIASGFSGPFAVVASHDGKFAYVTNFGSNNFAPFGNTVSIVDLTTYTIVDSIVVGIQPSGIDISLDDSELYVSSYNTLYAGASFTNLTAGQGIISVINIATKKVVKTILVGQSPSNVITSLNGNIYVSNYMSNTVTKIVNA